MLLDTQARHFLEAFLLLHLFEMIQDLIAWREEIIACQQLLRVACLVAKLTHPKQIVRVFFVALACVSVNAHRLSPMPYFMFLLLELQTAHSQKLPLILFACRHLMSRGLR